MSQLPIEMPEVIPAGDAAALIPLADEVSLEVVARMHTLARAIEGARQVGVRAVVIGRSNLMVHFDPLVLSFDDVRSLLQRLVARGLEAVALEGRLRQVPTVYGGPYGPDLSHVAEHHRMAEEEIVRLQSGATYLVCSLAFAPGQPFMMGLPRQLAMPRRPSPRTRVPAGSVAVANQTALYPFPSPGGWWLIGRTPLKLFDPSADPPTCFQPGDRIRFVPITEEEYLRMGGEKCT